MRPACLVGGAPAVVDTPPGNPQDERVEPHPTHPSDPAALETSGSDGDRLVEPAVRLAADWLRRARADQRRREHRVLGRLQGVVDDPDGVAFTMRFVDRVARHRDDAAAADQLAALVRGQPLPGFLSPTDRALLRLGAALAPRMPAVVMPMARRRMRQLVGHLVVDADTGAMHRHLAAERAQGFALNVNLLGEMVLGEEEAGRRFQRTLSLVDDPRVDYVSIKVSAIASQLDLWSFDVTLDRIEHRLRELFRRAAASRPPTFVNLDMEEYRDLHLTLQAFTRVLDEPDLRHLDAGIVLQAYLPDAFDALRLLSAWAGARHAGGGGVVKVRLVKGANLAMERVDAAMHGWVQAPFGSKGEVDAMYKRCVDWVLAAEHMTGLRVGLASHNLFDLAWAHLLAAERGLGHRVEMEMLQGISPAQARAVRDTGGGLRLYTPVVARRDFDIAIGYLFRRLEENTSSENFLRHLWTLEPGSAEFARQADQFRAAVADRWQVDPTPRRRATAAATTEGGFDNEPDTDPSLPSVQAWLAEVRRVEPHPVRAPLIRDAASVDAAVTRARHACPEWAARSASERGDVLRRVAGALASRRAELLATMAHEGRKTFAEADPEISEAIDFARWYGQRALEIDDLQRTDGVTFRPLGVVAVTPPWNFPVAIPAGGVLAALAAGNAVLFKPSLETPRCAEVVAEACWDAGVPPDVLQLVRTPDDEVGQHLVTAADAVILTGSWETSRLFRSWRPDMALFAETSGKNALVITPQADIDLAAGDLVRSAFGHSGQKCSAASLGILVGDLADDERFLGKVVDAARSLRLGWPTEPGTTMGPVIVPPTGKLLTALTQLHPGERWLLEPRRADGSGALWSPGIKTGVAPGSPFHQTEYFGPVLGLMRAVDLDEAIRLQNGVAYGLTGGIHSLDPGEVEQWLARVQVGNAYVNRHITGAIVRRQPFGGWKRSAIGPGAKAGGPDYVLQLGRWHDRTDAVLDPADSDRHWWDTYYSREHDPTGLFCEQNVLRYLPRPDVLIRLGADADPDASRRTLAAAAVAGVRPLVSAALDGVVPGALVEDDRQFASRLDNHRYGRVRHVGTVPAELRAASREAEVDVIDAPVVLSGRLELRWYLREQAVSRTLHRFGNLLDAPA
jgi:RHH-type transcriptional regulator, proline utilization regulon repressor / proline dehydrogenase / delta 1-pyrroline-5-carboxylate dehydrogenase